MQKVVAIVQARRGSTRLPDKIFCLLEGKPLLEHVICRTRAIKGVDEVVLATTNNQTDNLVEEWAKTFGVRCFRGSEDDVLSRYYYAANAYEADIIIRVTADDPFKDPCIASEVLQLFQQEKLEFAYNNSPPSFPEGLDVEVFSFGALEEAFYKSTEQYEREHVTQFLYRRLERSKQKNYSYCRDISFLRWTIDTEKDLEMARRVYAKLYDDRKLFLMEDILFLLKENPDIAKINKDVPRSAMYSRPS